MLQVLDEIDGFVGIQSYADWQQAKEATKPGALVVVDQKTLGNGLRYDVLQARAALKALGFDKLADPALGKVMITETGWPTSAPSQGAQQQHSYFNTIIKAAAGRAGEGERDPLFNVPLFLFMTFDDCLKPGLEEEQHFGLLSMSGKFKDGSAGTETVCAPPVPRPTGDCNKNSGAIKDPATNKVEQITCEEAFHRSWLQNSTVAPLKDLKDPGQQAFMAQNLAANWVASRTASLLLADKPLTCECYDMCFTPITGATSVASANPFDVKVTNLCASRGFWSEPNKRIITCIEGAAGKLLFEGAGSEEKACSAIAQAVPQVCYECGGCQNTNKADDFISLVEQSFSPAKVKEPEKLTLDAMAKVSCGLGQRTGAGVSYFDMEKFKNGDGEPVAMRADVGYRNDWEVAEYLVEKGPGLGLYRLYGINQLALAQRLVALRPLVKLSIEIPNYEDTSSGWMYWVRRTIIVRRSAGLC